MLYGCIMYVIWLYYACYMVVLCMLYGCIMYVIWLYYVCYMVVHTNKKLVSKIVIFSKRKTTFTVPTTNFSYSFQVKQKNGTNTDR